MEYGEVLLFVLLVCRIDGLHTKVKAKDKVVEIESQSQSIANCQLLRQVVEGELAARLDVIVTQGPDVSRVNKSRRTEFRKKVGAVFGSVEKNITDWKTV